MTPEPSVQTTQEGRSVPEAYPGQGEAVCLRSTRGEKLRVVSREVFESLVLAAGIAAHSNWQVADEVVLLGACACGCGLPVPHAKTGPEAEGLPATAEYVLLQKYADPEGCRKALYALMHPTLDLSGMLPEKAKQAARMAAEAVKAAKLGQPRATVDARSEVEHKALRPDPRQSCRLRVTPRHFELLAEIQSSGFYGDESFSGIVMNLIEREAEDCRLRARQEGEHDA